MNTGRELDVKVHKLVFGKTEASDLSKIPNYSTNIVEARKISNLFRGKGFTVEHYPACADTLHEVFLADQNIQSSSLPEAVCLAALRFDELAALYS